jgi:hypothetical protein
VITIFPSAASRTQSGKTRATTVGQNEAKELVKVRTNAVVIALIPQPRAKALKARQIKQKGICRVKKYLFDLLKLKMTLDF